MKKCPFCAEDIQDEAVLCKHCGTDLQRPPAPTARAPQGAASALVPLIARPPSTPQVESGYPKWVTVLVVTFAVLLVPGVLLIVIAIPTFLGARERANDKAAQSSLRNAVAAAKVVFTDTDDYSQVSPGTLSQIESSLTFTDGASQGPNQISLEMNRTAVDEQVVFASLSESGTCFFLTDTVDSRGFGGTAYSRSELDECAAANAPLIETGWELP